VTIKIFTVHLSSSTTTKPLTHGLILNERSKSASAWTCESSVYLNTSTTSYLLLKYHSGMKFFMKVFSVFLTLGLLVASNAPIAANANSKPKITAAQKLKMNQKSCDLILKRTVIFQERRSAIDPLDYPKLRAVYMAYAKYVDSFYYKTFGEVASTMGSLRDEVWQVADRSKDLNRVTKTTMDPIEIEDLTYALNNSLSLIDFHAGEFTNTCDLL
jgi:hypothetical protein